MKNILFLIVTLTISTTIFSQDVLVYRTNKMYCLFNFMEAACKRQGTSPTLQAFISKELKDDAQFSSLCTEYDNERYQISKSKGDFPPGRKQYVDSRDMVIASLISSTTWDEARGKVDSAFFEKADEDAFYRILQQSETYYDRIIWNEYREAIDKQVDALNQAAPQIGDMLLKLQHFYRTNKQTTANFVVSVYPIPGVKGITTASPHGNSLAIGVMMNESDVHGSSGVIVHEIGHVLYDNQEQDVQHELENWFTANTSPFAALAYNFFDEAMATATGNGWAYKQLNGEFDPEDWYNHEYISGFGKALYPLVESYLERKKQIDQAFVDQAITLFGVTFPRALFDYSALINRVTIYCEDQGEVEITRKLQAIGEHFQLTNCMVSSPLKDKGSINLLRNDKSTQLIILDEKQKENMKLLKKFFPTLKKLNIPKGGFNEIISFIDDQERVIIIMYAKDFKQIPTLVERMKQLKFINTDKLIQN